jgi:hypothetical protein
MTEGHEDAGDRRELLVEAPGADEITVLPWPLLMRARVQGRAQRSGSYPWLVLSAALFGLFTVGFSITVLSIAIEEIAASSTATGRCSLGHHRPLCWAPSSPSAGKLADLFGAPVYLCAMIL